MLFNSPQFLLVFLPLTLAAFILLGRARAAAMAILLLASAVFYGEWSIRYLVMLIALLSVNYLIGQALINTRSRWLLATGVVINLSVLGYFKYYGFFVGQVTGLFGTAFHVSDIVLPLGISFFTFQKIAYLVDCYRQRVPPHSYFSFSLFVLFFPQLIAGPITHAREIIPQFANLPPRTWLKNLAVGMTIVTIGLCKKMLLADNFSSLVGSVFDHATTHPPTLLPAWLGAIGFGLQIYFDFSGYSDIAIGLAYLVGIRLPVNFASPYQSRSVTEFWRRWHITLSRFLRDYLYIPLGGNRRGKLHQYVNLLFTLSLGGLWHGAGWTFVLWGGLHGLCLVIHKVWRHLAPFGMPQRAAWILTLLVIVLLWVPFRASSMSVAASVWSGMLGLNGFALNDVLAPLFGRGAAPVIESHLLPLFETLVVLPIGVTLVLFAPNTQTIMKKYRPVMIEDARLGSGDDWSVRCAWRPTVVSGVLVGGAFAACLLLFNDISQFIYFQF